MRRHREEENVQPSLMSTDDKLAVNETVYRYALGVDTRDFTLYRSIFTPRLEIDFTSYYGGGEPAVMTADEWVAGVRPVFTGLAATQHSMTNPIAEIDGDTARCRMYVRAHHVHLADDPTSWFTIGGVYDDRLVRSSEAPVGWLISAVTLTVFWRAGDPAIMTAAAAAGRAILDGGGATSSA
jgi:hypothetical protein